MCIDIISDVIIEFNDYIGSKAHAMNRPAVRGKPSFGGILIIATVTENTCILNDSLTERLRAYELARAIILNRSGEKLGCGSRITVNENNERNIDHITA